ncbi:MAG TPA: proline dehydrogenase family protein [Thermoanaerobaculia bacterium]|nr:proline dehydrogenase family protein [Thermoanaerobaculia bacterium]
MSLFDRAVAATLPLVPSPVVRRVASRYVAGESLDDALGAVSRLNREGASATLDVLGEDVTRREETRFFVDEYRRALAGIAERGLDSNVSVKLTAMGLKFDPELAWQNFREIAAEARSRGNFVRIDMEDSSVTQPTIDLFRRARTEFDNVGIVLQAYLRRTQSDVARAIAERWSVRICKGIYLEPREIAFRDPDLIRRNYAYAADRLLEARVPVGIATHDEAMVLEALHSIERRQARREDYEFQMLMGVAVGLRRLVIRAGHRLRVYVPYGTAWKGYSLRRLKENPAIVRHVLAGMFRREDDL